MGQQDVSFKMAAATFNSEQVVQATHVNQSSSSWVGAKLAKKIQTKQRQPFKAHGSSITLQWAATQLTCS
ncbi:hypothetical protein ACLOJK_004645 [Asimina triloba]